MGKSLRRPSIDLDFGVFVEDAFGAPFGIEANAARFDAFGAGMPESFNVLVKEIRSLGIDIELERN